jgi:hypothetical protein
MTNQKRHDKSQSKSDKRLEDRRKQNDDPHDLERPPDLDRRSAEDRRTQSERK